MNGKNLTKVVFGPVRFSYVHVFTPDSINGSEAKYSVSIIIPKSDKKTIKSLEKAIELAKQNGINDKWKGVEPKKLQLPLHDGDEDKTDEAYQNCMYLNAKCKTKPGVVDANRQPIIDEEEFYSGCYGYASVTFYAYEANGNKGVSAGLNNVMKTKDGERLGGRISADQDFAEIDEISDDEEDL